MTALLEVEALESGYGEARVLRGASFAVAEGTITAVIGGNGAGKTTLMRAVAGLIPVFAGSVRFDGSDITQLSPSARVGRRLALVPEGRLVFPDFTVQETLRIGAYPAHARHDEASRIAEMYELFPRLEERRRTRAGALSGGEQQMLALARGLMSAPRLLLLDEPSLGLAPGIAARLFEAILEIRRRGTTVCLVEQDVHSTLQIADHAYVLANGAVTLQGLGRELLGSTFIRESYLGL
jgi:branched-chain amino acid transport system ATP-binding protein